MSCCLVLNADYSPLSVAPLSTQNWKEVIKQVYLDQVEVIELYDDWFVHSPSTTLQVPSVVVSKTYVRSSRTVKFNKTNLCIRDEFLCQYCHKKFDLKQLTMDHVLPRCMGGKTNWQNIAMSCHHCNTTKGHKTIMKPRREPVKPQLGDIIAKAKRMPIVIPNENWIPYIGWQPKLITVKNPKIYFDSDIDNSL